MSKGFRYPASPDSGRPARPALRAAGHRQKHVKRALFIPRYFIFIVKSRFAQQKLVFYALLWGRSRFYNVNNHVAAREVRILYAFPGFSPQKRDTFVDFHQFWNWF